MQEKTQVPDTYERDIRRLTEEILSQIKFEIEQLEVWRQVREDLIVFLESMESDGEGSR